MREYFCKTKYGLILACLSLMHAVSTQAQSLSYAPSKTTVYAGPVDALASRLFAQSDYLRASGDATVSYSVAREIRARAARLEIVNAVDRVKAYWEIRSIAEAERMKRAYNHLDSKKLRNKNTWDRLKNHPDINYLAIPTGKPLNFLLSRLSSSVLAYEFSKNSSRSDVETVKQLQLPTEVLNHLSLRQRLTGGRQLIFRPNEQKPLDVKWWPYALRSKEFDSYRNEFLRERTNIIEQAQTGDSTIDDESLKSLNQAFLNLSDEFRRKFTRRKRFANGMESWGQFQRANLFLKSLWGEIGLLKSSGNIGVLDAGLEFHPEENGSDIIALLTFMSRNGLDFAPAEPQDVASYHQVFAMMRDLYINIAEEDAALKPLKEINQR